MPNPNYRRGRDYEYKVMQQYKSHGFTCIRASGSHGKFDLVAIRFAHPVSLVQCKTTAKESVALKLVEDFKLSPPLIPDRFYHQILTCYCTTNRQTYSVTV